MSAALAGGVGGAKLADGLATVVRSDLGVVVNTGDDFGHCGLAVSPDLDSVISATTVAAHCKDLAHGMVDNKADAGLAGQIKATRPAVQVVPTLMRSALDRRNLSLAFLDFACDLVCGAAAR